MNSNLLKKVTTDRGLLNTGDVLTLPCTVNYFYIDSDEAALEAVERILPLSASSENMLAIDIETTGFDPYLDEIVTCQVGTADDLQYIFDFRKIDPYILRPVFLQPCWKIGHNIKFDAKFLKVKLNVDMSHYFDTFIAEKVLRGGSYTRGVGYALDAVLLDRLSKELKIEFKSFGGDYEAKVKSAKKTMQKSFMGLKKHDQPLSKAQLAYAAQDVAVGTIFSLVEDQKKELMRTGPSTLYDPQMDTPGIDPEIYKSYNSIFPKHLSLWPTALLEFKFIEVVVDMEVEGIGFCKETHAKVLKNILKDYSHYKSAFLKLMAKNCKQKTLLGLASINPDSNQQVLEAFKEMGLELEDTKAATLDNLLRELDPKCHEYEVISNLTGYRKMSKLVDSFGEALVDQVHPLTGRIHPSVEHVLTTGRISMSNPNLQQIPRGVPWVMTGDKEKDEKIKKRDGLRECFKAKDGNSFLIYDYSAQELRVAASISMDRLMLQAFKEEKDLHSFSATLMYHEDYEDFAKKVEDGDKEAKEKRTHAKIVSFGSLYGSGPSNLSKTLRVSMDEAKDIIRMYWDAYPELALAMPRYGELANKFGYSNTILGRRRYYTDNLTKIKYIELEQDPKVIDKKVRDLKMTWLVEDGPITRDNMRYAKKKIVDRFRAKINRESGNHHIQGTSADMMKLAAVAVRRSIAESKVNASIVGLVHDEVIVECADEDLEAVEAIVQQGMKDAMTYFCPNVPAEVDGHVSPHWMKG